MFRIFNYNGILYLLQDLRPLAFNSVGRWRPWGGATGITDDEALFQRRISWTSEDCVRDIDSVEAYTILWMLG